MTELIEQEAALGDPAWWFAQFPNGTHWDRCWQHHAACAFALGAAQVESARSIAVRLEQENAELLARCGDLITEWTRSGSMQHAAQLAEAIDLTSAPSPVADSFGGS